MTHHSSTPTLRPIRMPDDAERLAQMWNASDDQWPGTVSDGVPITAQWVIDREGREKSREVMVWDAGDTIAGYCSLWDWPQEPHVTYIATLNVAPAFQKLGLGRRFLQYYVERATALGSHRLDLHTWPGNLKAVPLYKKCGFFWMPGGGGVHMYNFLPTILTMPAARGFFERHSWYDSLRRELTQAEDDERWEGMKVFTYRFESGGERLTVWVDREARRVTGVETDALFAAALAEDQEPARGTATTLRWRVGNRGAAPVQVSLIATGDGALAIDHRATLTVAPGATVELAAPVRVAAVVPEQRHDFATPTVRSLLVVDGQVLEFGTGMRPHPAVEVQTEPEQISLTPGVPRRVELRLRSRVRRDVTLTAGLTATPGLALDTTGATLDLPAGGLASIPVELRAERAGVFELPVTIALRASFANSLAPAAGSAGAPTLLPATVQTIFALAPGGALAARVGDGVRLENDTVRLRLPKLGANLQITALDGAYLADESATPAPPAFPSLFHETDFELRQHDDGGQIVVTATAESRDHPGLVLHKVLRFGGGPVFSTALEFENRSSAPLRLYARRWLGGDGESTEHVMPLAAGLTRAPMDIMPSNPDDEFKRPGAFAERWVARERPDLTLGIVWGDDMAEFEWGHVMASREYEVPPHARVQTAPLHWYAGPGDWRAVRKLYARLAGAEATRERPAAHLRAGLKRPAALVDDRGAATLLVEHRLARPLAGEIALALPEGWRADRERVAFEGVTYREPARVELALSADVAPGAYEGRAELRCADHHGSFALPLLRLGDHSAVTVQSAQREGQRVLTVANGRLELDVTPDFGGAVSAMRDGGVNQLDTPFPSVGAIGWMSPWYGGVMPVVMPRGEGGFPGKIGREHFEAAPVEVADARGVVWRGVRQRAAIQHEDLRGVTLEIDSLTLGGSPLVKLVMRLVNAAPASRPLGEAGWLVFVRPGGQAGHVAHTPEHQVHPSDRMVWISSEHWLAAEHPSGGPALALVGASGLALAGFGGAGTHFKLILARAVVPAGGTLEIAGYLALARDLAEARRYAALKDLL